MKLTILHVVTLSERGGAQRHVLDLSRAQVEQGHRVHLACGPGGPLIGEAEASGVAVLPQSAMVRRIDPVRDALELSRLVSLIGRLRPDIVHGHSSKAGLLARAAARLRGVPSVYTAHGFVFLEPLGAATRRAYLWMERAGARLGTRLIAVSSRDADAARRYGVAGRKPVAVVHNGYRPPRAPVPAPAAEPFRIVGIANPYPTKGLDVLVEALRDPILRDVSIEVEIAGDGPLRAELERRAAGFPIRFLGRVDDVHGLLDAAHAAVLPSRKEGWPYAVLEAMGASRPVIATDVGGIPEQLDGDRCGWIVAPGDATALAKAMLAAAADPADAARRGEEGYRRVTRVFTVEEMVERVEREYHSARADRP